MTELKAGDSLDFVIGDKTLTVEPVPYGNIKKVVRLAFDVSKEISSGELKSVPELIDKNLYHVLPLLFAKGKYPWLTQEWIEDTLTVPVIRKMMEAAIVVNGLQDFFDQAKGKGKANGGSNGNPTQPTQPTQPERHGYTTSADSPTDGVQKTLTS